MVFTKFSRLLINLTSPALMVYNEELPSEKVTRGNYLQILSHLQEYKSGMANECFWSVVNEKIKEILAIVSLIQIFISSNTIKLLHKLSFLYFRIVMIEEKTMRCH